MNRIYKNIGMALLLTAVACSTDNAIEDPFIDESGKPAQDGSVANNPYWGWVTEFPGFIPADLARENTEITLTAQSPLQAPATAFEPKSWQSAGYYAAPGEYVTITVPAGVSGLKYRIGGFTDIIPETATSFKRYANMDIEGDLMPGENKVMSYFGGQLYFFYETSGNATTLQLAGVVKSPDFIMGETDAAAWKQEIATTIMPWAELRSPKVILTLPVSILKEVSDPEALLNFYDDMISMDFDGFYSVTTTQPWRLRTDVQTSTGSDATGGYPSVILKGVDSAAVRIPALQDPNILKVCQSFAATYQQADLGGEYFKNALLNLPYHRLYHRNQTWPVANLEFEGAIGSFVQSSDPAKRFYDLTSAQQVGMFVQLAQQYGWNVFPYIAKQVRENEAPAHDQDKNDALAMYATEYANQNLTPFFDAWGFTLSSYATNYMEQFPAISTPFWNSAERKFGDFDTRTAVTMAKGVRPTYTVLDRSSWSVQAKRIAGGVEEDNEHVESAKIGKAALMIDGDATTIWHSKWSGEGAEYPHVIDIDMKTPTSFNYLYYQHRNTQTHNNKCRRFQLLIEKPDGTFEAVDNDKMFTLGKTTDMQYIYLDQTYETSKLKLRLVSPHPLTGDPYSDAERQSIAVSIAEFGVGMLQ